MHYHIPRLLYYHVSGCTFPWASGMTCLTSSVPVNWRGAGTENWITMEQEVRHHSLVVSSILDVNQVGRELKLSRKYLREHFQAKFSCSAGLVAVETYNGIFQHTQTVGIQDKTQPFISTNLRHVALSPILCCHPQSGQLSPSPDRQQLDRCG